MWVDNGYFSKMLAAAAGRKYYVCQNCNTGYKLHATFVKSLPIWVLLADIPVKNKNKSSKYKFLMIFF